ASTIGVHAGVPLRGTHELELFSVESDKRWPALELGTHESKAGVTLARASQLWRLTFFRGIERSMMRDPTFLDREFTGFGAEATWLAGPGVLRVSGQRVRNAYLQFSQLFLANRVDDFYELQATYEYAIGSKWFLVPRAVWQQNRSNIAVVGFERRVWQIELRRDFY
ncbi:MAG TPA: hypothetical protein VFJ95_12210, partial [Gammaproteobacteria bacterium]|nr:hypothetical protein [Gammaproteobacteria bacterium]